MIETEVEVLCNKRTTTVLPFDICFLIIMLMDDEFTVTVVYNCTYKPMCIYSIILSLD